MPSRAELDRIPDVWHNCYDDSWDAFIVPEAFAHPAKFARGLITRILVEMRNAGMVQKGDSIVDPFGGIGTGGIVAASMGYQWYGCELESKFHGLGQQNFAMHAETWRQFGDPLPVLVNGDSRNLRANLAGALADAVMSSPPYTPEVALNPGDKSRPEAKIARLRAEGKLREAEVVRQHGSGQASNLRQQDYGATPGQLGAMKPGSVDSVVSSPPYAAVAVAKSSEGVDKRKQWETYRSQGGGMGYEAFVAQQAKHSGDYGSSDGQLSKMTAGDVDAVIGSPPFSGSDQPCASQTRAIKDYHAFTRGDGTKRDATHTGETPGQLSALPTGQVDAVLSSPPYAECLQGDNTARESAEESRAKRKTEGGSLGQSCRHQGYGGPGNLGNLPAGAVDAIATSPPHMSNTCRGAADPIFAHKFNGDQRYSDESPRDPAKTVGGDRNSEAKRIERENRAANVANLGEIVVDSGATGLQHTETFWAAAKLIVEECHAILKPGGYSAWVCKDFIRNKQRVPFCDDWCKLLEACGFTVVKRVRAMLVKEQRHPDLFGGDEHVERTERKSFFRRLYEKKFPENSINWEEVIFAQKEAASV